MNIIGVIVEYNPLHNGHSYHIEEIRKTKNPDLIIAIMSGSFTMRGDISMFTKFVKAKEALQNQVDLVIELPSTYTVNNANIFAEKAVAILNQLKVNEIVIGSEDNSSAVYQEYYLASTNDTYIHQLREALKEGYSYKVSSNIALNALGLKELEPNDQLGLAYYTAIKNNNLDIKLSTIKRIGDNFSQTTTQDSKYTSAMALRKNPENIKEYAPSFVYDDYKNEMVFSEEKLFSYLKYRILTSSKEYLNKIFFIEEGLENNLKKIVTTANSYNELISSLTTKRYTSSRIKRMLFYLLFNITKDEMNEILATTIIRVLGYNALGRKYLSIIKKDVSFYTNIKEGINPTFDIEIRISKTLDLIYNSELFKKEQAKQAELN